MITVQEDAEKNNVTVRTVYRWIEDGSVDAKKHLGRWVIVQEDDIDVTLDDVDEEDDNSSQKEIIVELRQRIEDLADEVQYLRSKLDSASEERQRSDTIILTLSNQLADERKKLEDLRDRSIWIRVKTALGFAAS